MKRKLLSLLLCAAIFIGILPVVSFAAGTAAAAKLGAENGDTVLFAGKGSTPVKWRVIDKAKTNTGNTNGMLLLSENTLYNVTSTDKTTSWLNKDCGDFYNAYFAAAYKNAVMTVSKTDGTYKINSDEYSGSLPSGTAVFALSAHELDGMSDGLKKFPGSDNWWLRTMCPKGSALPLSYYTYASAETGEIKNIITTSANKGAIKLRPAVNLNKSKLAAINGKLLLLPAGSSANEWKLSLKNDINISAYTAYNTEDSLELNVTASSGADCISVIIVKADGTISYYKQNDLKQTIPVTLPADTDAKTDAMYVFAEKSNGALTGSVSDPVKVCISHKLEYTALGDSAHHAKCCDCGYEVTQSHNFGQYTVTQQGHEQTCSICGFVNAKAHNLTYTKNDAKTHSASCICGYKAENLEHTYVDQIGDEPVIFTCSKCGAVQFTALKGMFGNMALRDEYKPGTAYVNGNKLDIDKTIFTNDDEIYDLHSGNDGTATLTFDTKRPVKAEGFQIRIKNSHYAVLPETLSLYGKNSENVYEEIGTAVLRSIAGEKSANAAYSFVFSARPEFNAYDSFKLEAELGTNSIDLAYFGLISEEPNAAVSFDLDGILATDAPGGMYSGEDYTAAFISKDGNATSGDLTVYENGEPLNSEYYSVENGVLKIPGQYINAGSEYKIKGVHDKNVKVKLASATIKNDINQNGIFGEEYVTGFTVASGNQQFAPKSLSDIHVSNKYGFITDRCTLDSEGRLHIPGELILGDLVWIFAEENGRNLTEEKAAVKVTKDDRIDRYFADMDEAKAVIEMDGETDITLLKDTYANEPVTLSGKVNIDLGGHTLTSQAGNPALNIGENAEVGISNGNLCSDWTEIIVCVSGGVLTLNNVIMPEPEHVIYVRHPGKLILDGADSDTAVYLYGGTFEQHNGTSRLSAAYDTVQSIRLYGGTVEKCDIGKTDMFTLIDGGYVFELADAEEFTDFVKNVIGTSFTVKKADIITAQPQDISISLGETARLTTGAAEGSGYYWFDTADSERVCLSDKNYLEIGADAQPGEHSYRCAVLTGSTVFQSRTVHVTVICHHDSVTNGVCDKCGAKAAAQVTADGKTEVFENIGDAIAFANGKESAVIKLLGDVAISDYVYFTGKNIMLDMNGKTFASDDINRFISVKNDASLTVTGSGNMTARLMAENQSVVTIENGTFKEVLPTDNSSITVNGGTFALFGPSGGTTEINGGTFTEFNVRGGVIVLNGGIFGTIHGIHFYNYLPEGKAYADADDGRFDTENYEYYIGEDSCIKNVTIKDAPFAITKQPKGRFAAEGSQNDSVSVEVEENEAYKGEITYKWAVGTYDYLNGEFTAENENAGDTAEITVDTEGLGGGTYKTYRCTVSCGGYVQKTDFATFIIGKGKPTADLENEYVKISGNDCVLVAAVYNGNKLAAVRFVNLNKDDAYINIDTVIDPLWDDIGDSECDMLKLFFADSLDNMKPIGDISELNLN